MTTRRRLLQRAVTALSILAVPVVLSKRAHAVPVVDAAGIAQALLQFQQTLAQVQATTDQVEALRAAARQLDPRSYETVQTLLSGNDFSYQSLIRDIRSIGYTLDRVDTQFERLFPNEQAIRNMRPSEFRETSRDMNRELHSSALVAARAQTTLRAIEANNAEARNVLSRSQGNGSQVAQLQAALQMLGLVHQNLVSITQTVSSAGRVTSNLAAAGVTERRISRERKRRLLRGYDRPSRTPGIDRRFLRGE